MIENQHNDNLEQFFKANLEGYKPAPSADFWSRMEGAIPPKPPFWRGWKLAFLKWAGVVALATALFGVVFLWQRDRHKMKKLNKTVASQQAKIKAFEEQTMATIPNEEKKNKTEGVDAAASTIIDNEVKNSTKDKDSASDKQASNAIKFNAKPATKPSIAYKAVIPPAQPITSQLIENNISNHPTLANSTNAPIDLSAAKLPDLPSEFSPEPHDQNRLQPPSQLAALDASVVPSKKQIPLTKHKLRRANNPYPGFSIEVGATAFRMPLGRLFEQDTFLSGRTGISYGTGVRVNYEINSTTSFQAGYQFNNLRAKRLALRYNQFPFLFQKRWAWSRRGYLEGKIGASINSLVSTNADSDGGTVKGLRTTWMGIHAAISAALPISDKLKFVVGPSTGLSATPMTNGRHSWELGIAASMRYQL